MKGDSSNTDTRIAGVVRGLVRGLVVVAMLAGLAGLAYWGLISGYLQSDREEADVSSVKIAPRRIQVPGSHEVLIRLDAATQRRIGLTTAPVERVRWQKTVTMLGSSVVVPQRAAELRSPWNGILQNPPDGTMPSVGQQVKQDQVLGVLQAQWSPTDRLQLENQLREAQGTAGETEAEIQVARKALERLRQVDTGAIAPKQIVDAEGSLAKLEARLSSARSREKALRTALGKKQSEVQFQFVAPQAGQITRVAHRAGEVLAAGDLVASVYDPSELWVAASLPPGQLKLTEAPAKAEIHFPGFESQTLTARLVYSPAQVEPQQQARPFVYHARNPEGRIPIGLQAVVRAKVGAPEELLAVNRSAVLQRAGQRLVYVQRGPEDYAKQPVEVVDEDGDRVYLRPVLPPGTKVVQRGAQCLLSEEYKESIQLVEEGGKGEKNEAREPDER